MRVLNAGLLLALAAAAWCMSTVVDAHSWVHCVDYKGNIAKNVDYDNANCQGWPRSFTNYINPSIFGFDRGFNYQASGDKPTCITSFTTTSYTNTYPMATYQPGERIRLVWPAKNHQASRICTNIYIPDTSLKLFMDCNLSGGRNPAINTFAVDSKMVIDFKANGGKGFQNCPDFCNNTDKAVCFQDFTVPSNIPVGSTCTFLWYWIFNNNDIPYTTCWEACIGGGCNAPAPAPTNRPTPNPTPAITTPTNAPTRRPTRSPTPAPTVPVQTPSPTNPVQTPAPTNSAQTPAPTRRPTRSPTPNPTPAQNVPVPTSTPGTTTCRTTWQQCGGKEYNGATCCSTGNHCVYLSEWYSQCWPDDFNQEYPLEDELAQSSSKQHSKKSLIILFVGATVGSALFVVGVGAAIILIRRRRSVVSQEAAEVFIPLEERNAE